MTRTSWLLAGLAISLGVNFFAVAYFAGAWSPRADNFEMETLLPRNAELRQEIRAELADRRDELGPALRRLQQARRTVLEVASSADFDRSAMQAALLDLRDATVVLQAIAQDALLAVVQESSPEQRQAFKPTP